MCPRGCVCLYECRCIRVVALCDEKDQEEKSLCDKEVLGRDWPVFSRIYPGIKIPCQMLAALCVWLQNIPMVEPQSLLVPKQLKAWESG